jgi:hypothetical protein
VQRASGIPHAHIFSGRTIFAKLGRVVPREREGVFDENARTTFPIVITREAGDPTFQRRM